MSDAEIFVAIRKKYCLSQRMLAQRLEVTIDTVRGIEHGRWRASFAIMYRLSVEFSEPEFRFCGRDTTMTKQLKELYDMAIDCYKNYDYDNAYKCTDKYLELIDLDDSKMDSFMRSIAYNHTSKTWGLCIGRMLQMTRAIQENHISIESIKLCLDGIRIGGYRNFDPYGETPVHLTNPVKQLLNLCGLVNMRLGNFDDALRLFRSLFLCLELDLMGYGAREDIYSQMATAECNRACAMFLAGYKEAAVGIMDRALEFASNGASAKRIGEMLKYRIDMSDIDFVDITYTDNSMRLEKYYCLFALSLLPESRVDEKRSFKGILML